MQRAGIREHMDAMKAKRHLRKALYSTVAGVSSSHDAPIIYVWLRAYTCSLEANFLGGSMPMGPCLSPCTS